MRWSEMPISAYQWQPVTPRESERPLEAPETVQRNSNGETVSHALACSDILGDREKRNRDRDRLQNTGGRDSQLFGYMCEN